MTEFSSGSLKSIVELTSAGAILVGLIFVGLELKQNTAASQADTMQGLLEMRQQGAHTVAQDEASCVVYGMPKAAADLKAAERIVTLKKVPAEMIRFAQA